MAIFLGLAVAVVYGTADFLGGRTSRGNRPAAVVAVSQLTSLVAVGALLAVDGTPPPGAGALTFGAASGVAGLLGVLLLYRGLAVGTMGVIAPVTAVGAAVVPISYGIITGDRPSAPALLGIVLALGAVGLVASGGGGGDGPQRRTSNRELALAGAAGAGFGASFIFLAESGPGTGFWPVLAARAVSAPLALLVATPGGGSLRISRGTRLQVVASGTLDAAAIALYLLASRRGLISLVAALGSLYPGGHRPAGEGRAPRAAGAHPARRPGPGPGRRGADRPVTRPLRQPEVPRTETAPPGAQLPGGME
jgi:uncharacterized membrane protein